MAKGMDSEGAPGPETVPVLFLRHAEEKTEKAQARRQKNQQNESTFIVGWKMGTHESVVMMHRRNADGIRDCEREGRKEKCRNPEKGRKNGEYGNTRKRGQMRTEQSRKNSGFSEKKI